MASLKSIRKRIASVKSTQKITKAMKMVAGARLNRAQQRILALRPYAVKTGEIVQSVAASMIRESEMDGGADGAIPGENDGPPHPLLARRPESNVLVILLSGDR